MRLLIIGAGAWGTALAVAAATHVDGAGAARHAVTLLARGALQRDALLAAQAAGLGNAQYLPDTPLPAALRIEDAGRFAAFLSAGSSSTVAAVTSSAPFSPFDADLIVIATPVSGVREWLTKLADCQKPVAWLCKGFESLQTLENGKFIEKSSNVGDIWSSVAPHLRAGILSGPSFAQEVASGKPTALVAASPHAEVRDALVAAFHSPTLRVYASDDLVGVEVGGAVKNVLAIATGLCDGLDLGLNARAALITRGLAEMTRLGVALGAKAETFMGLSGLGDLVLTATGDLSRNRQVGLLLARGHSAAQATASLGHVAEGVRCASAVLQRARSVGVGMPITECVVALLSGRLLPQSAVALLMGREPAAE
jgi:glycerol-3-phosphate dehydrogenase (NAD(P)+)